MASEGTAKGQRRFHVSEPGWVEPEGGQGRFAAFPLGDGDHDPLVVVVWYAPGVRIGVHSHDSDYWSMVVEGEVEVTRRMERAGDIRFVRGGTAYGPLVVGAEGATVVEVFGDRTAFTAPRFLSATDRAAAEGSPMPALALAAIAQAWAAPGDTRDKTND